MKYKECTTMENWKKYEKTYFMPPEPCYDWVKKDSIDKAPIWCSVDLRDGNQARSSRDKKCIYRLFHP